MRKNRTMSMLLALLLFFSFANVQPMLAEDVTKSSEIEKNVKSTDERDSTQGKQSLENKIMPYAISQYTMADLNLLSDSELIALIPTLQWEQITDLFEYNDAARKFYSNKTRMAVLLKELEVRGRTFTTTDSLGIPTFVEIIRAGYYLGFYNSQLGYLDTIAERNKCVPAITALVSNPNFGLGTTVQDGVVSATGLFANAAFVNTTVVNKLADVVKNYVDNVDTYINDLDKGTAAFNVLSGTNYAISSYVRMSGVTATNSEFYGTIDPFINQVMRIANLPTLTEQNAWLINNGLYYTGELADYLSDKSQANRTLTNAVDIYPYLGKQYFQALDKIATKFKSIDYNGKNINYAKAIEDGKAYHLPKTYNFDNGTMIIKTGDKVSEEKVKRLYWASKEVKAQFFRMYGSDKALEPGNPDDRLEMVIYNTPEHYEMNRYLYGLETNNGGMYIEPDGRFFTYERTPQDSIYSLEELFRHEFTHYLQGRYLVKGMWGYGSIYENERLTWYEEGGAELFAGATRTEGIKMRQSMVGNIASNQSNRFSLRDTLYAKYGSFEFYTYAFVFMSYLYENDLYAFNRLAKYINTSDVTNYDAYRSELSLSSRYNSGYKSYMQSLYESYDTLTTPLVSDDYLLNHPTKPAQEVYNKIGQVATLSNVTTSINASPMFNTFTLKGTYTGTYTYGKEADWKKMNDLADKFLIQLSNDSWSGYKTLTAYFTDYRLDANNNFVFDVTFTGIATWDVLSDNLKPIISINGPYNGEVDRIVRFSSEGSKDEDGSIVSYLWAFGDGTESTEANPTHIYKEVGTYEVSLTITDNLGGKSTSTTTVTVDVQGPLKEELEENDSIDTANGAIGLGVPVSASIDGRDIKDYFYIDITEPTNMNIAINDSNIEMGWILYSAEDNNKAVAYPDVDGKNPTGSYNAKPGRYYIKVYKTKGTESNYSLIITEGERENIDPTVNINGPYTGMKGENIAFSSVGTNDADGNIASYLWMFGDGSESTEANPAHAYMEAGTYDISLTVTDNEGAKVTVTTKVTINPETGGSMTEETEGNDSIETANGPIVPGVPVSASFDADDSSDYYYLELSEPSTINITVNNFNNIRLNWLLYSANDTNQYIAYPSIIGNSAVGSYVAQPGKYYINVYKTEGASSNYTLTVNVVPEGGTGTLTESEANDTFETADALSLNSTLVGNLNDDDYTDNFTFDVSQNSNLKIDVTLQSNAQASWVLYNEENMNEYYSYADKVDGVLTNKVVVIPGKYFLRIYKIQGITAPYELKINEVE